MDDDTPGSGFKARAQAHFRAINAQPDAAAPQGRIRRRSETELPAESPAERAPREPRPPRKPRDDKPRAERGEGEPEAKPKGARPERGPRPTPAPKDGSELAELTREEAFKRVFTHAGRLVSMKDWSRKGLAERLGQRFKKAPEGAALAQEAAAKMAAIGAIQDERYARGFLRSRLAKKSASSALRDLALHGVGKEDGMAAMESLREEGLVAEPADQAWAVWRKKFDRYPADERERAKQARHMASRGFSYDAISKVWAKAKNGMGEGDED